MKCLIFFSVFLLLTNFPTSRSCPSPPGNSKSEPKCPSVQPEGKQHEPFADQHLKSLVDIAAIPCISGRDGLLNSYSYIVREQHYSRLNENGKKNDLFDIAKDMLPGIGTQSCFDKMTDQVEDLLKISFPHEPYTILSNYPKKLDELLASALQNCEAAGATESGCRSTYMRSALDLYDQLVNDQKQIMQISELPTVFFIKSICTVRFLVATHYLSYESKHLNYAADIFYLYKVKLGADMKTCFSKMGEALDTGLQRWQREKMPLPIALRALLWRHFLPWMSAFKELTEIRDCPLCDNDVRSPPDTSYLRNGSTIMLRDTGDPNNPNEWFSCSENDKKQCFCTTCAGYGAPYNSTGMSLGTWSSGCDWQVFTIIVDPTPSGNRGTNYPIEAYDLVHLVSNKGHRVWWDIVKGEYKADNGDTCQADFLSYMYDEQRKADPTKSSFILHALDWTGRRRERHEKIRDRDYLIFNFQPSTIPDYKRLYHGYGLYYIEGMVFVAPLKQ